MIIQRNRAKKLLPVPGCFVRDQAMLDQNINRVGIVRSTHVEDSGQFAMVRWPDTQHTAVIPVERLRNGFSITQDVVDKGGSSRGVTLGHGAVAGTRRLGSRDQVLVEFASTGKRHWLPFEVLSFAHGVRRRFQTARTGKPDGAERLRLRVLAQALEVWNENTGALAQLDIDPLPHQIHLVHHILSSGNLNWLIADDVGLGKTIETGMLLSALRQRDVLKRALLITPAGLTRQWKEEMFYKFGFSEFRIYGDDFSINEAREWSMYDFVIGSMDRFKSERHLQLLLEAGHWDVVIFDEGHRLTRRQYGNKFDESERFGLARKLRPMADAFLILSATPHQGMQDKFAALLELLRPECKEDIDIMTLNPAIISDMVYRNFKADVTDADGNFIFRGKRVSSVQMDASDEAVAFDESLQRYLKRGYSASASKGGASGRAIGFVMTTYRKLAASSAAAIATSLQRRLDTLRSEASEHDPDEFDMDGRFEGEWEELQVGSEREFFAGEISVLQGLVKHAETLYEHDTKLQGFVDNVIAEILAANTREKVLIFTEYRSTQNYIKNALVGRYGESSTQLINGSMDLAARAAAIAEFEGASQFLVSTEAGGEGINLQRHCHIMVNYDLPWNPMRLVQRVGRLYRYGQQKPVQVFNLHVRRTVDENVVQLMYQRLDAVVADMSNVQANEFDNGLADDVLGEMADLLDIASVLEEATTHTIKRTRERIDDALEMASAAAKKQRELFEHAASYEVDELSKELRISAEHLRSFVLGMCDMLGIEIANQLHQGKVLQLRVPESLYAVLSTNKARVDVTFDRRIASERADTQMLDANSPILRHLLSVAKQFEFDGQTAGVMNIDGTSVQIGMLRWQNARGQRMLQSLNSVHSDGELIRSNLPSFSEWLLNPQSTAAIQPDKATSKAVFGRAEAFMDEKLSSEANANLHPESLEWVAAAWNTEFPESSPVENQA